MSSCNELKKGDILYCEDCGLELTVTKACSCGDEDSGACAESGFSCCGMSLKKK